MTCLYQRFHQEEVWELSKTGYTNAWKGMAVLVCAAALAGSASAVLLRRSDNAEGGKADTLSVPVMAVSAAESSRVLEQEKDAVGQEKGALEQDKGTPEQDKGTPEPDSGTGQPPAAPRIQLETYAGIPCEARLGDGLTVTVEKPPEARYRRRGRVQRRLLSGGGLHRHGPVHLHRDGRRGTGIKTR